MRSLWFQGIVLLGAIALALAMLAVNSAFQAVGSLPDLESCDFLTGGTPLLLVLYPLVAGLVAARAARPLARRFPDEEERILSCGSRIGFGGAALYFIANLLLLAFRPHAETLPPLLCVLLVLFTLLTAGGGRLGAMLALSRMKALAWRGGEG